MDLLEPCKSPFCIFRTEEMEEPTYTPCIHLDLPKIEMRVLLRKVALEYLKLRKQLAKINNPDTLCNQ